MWRPPSDLPRAAFLLFMTSIVFPARFEYLDEIRTCVGQQARAAGFSERGIYAVQLAVDEAASNIIEHAYEGQEGGTIELICEADGDRLIVTLLDRGKPFDPTQVPAPDIHAKLSERKIGGLGIYLMRKLVDEVRYQVTPSGNRLTLIKRRC